MIILAVIGGIIALFLLWLWATYNGLVKLGVRVDGAWSDITVALKRRYDLVPNLVETVKGYAKHEKDVFTDVTKARTAAMGATQSGNPEEMAANENIFAGALKSLFAVSEAYPELKANENFLQLQNELVDTEDKIQASRRFYNTAAGQLNIKIKQFPTNLFAQRLGFGERKFFEVADRAEVEKAVDVDFSEEK